MKRLTLFSALLCLLPRAAIAHVVLDPPSAPSGAYFAGFFRVAHGCGGAPTTSVTVEIPRTVMMAKPQPKPGWTLSVAREKLPVPIKGEGGAQITERVVSVTWSGTLADENFDQFGLLVKLPAAAGMLYFPVTQTCETGAVHWSDIPAKGQAWHDVPHPAPVLHMSPKSEDAHMHMNMNMPMGN